MRTQLWWPLVVLVVACGGNNSTPDAGAGGGTSGGGAAGGAGGGSIAGGVSGGGSTAGGAAAGGDAGGASGGGAAGGSIGGGEAGGSVGGGDAGGSVGGGDSGGGAAGGIVGHAPVLSMVRQQSGSTPVAAGATVAMAPTFAATITDGDGDNVQLEVEVVALSASFTGTPTVTSASAPAGAASVAPPGNLTPGSWQWQARARDANGNTSAWQRFGVVGQPSFVLQPTGTVQGTIIIDGGATASSGGHLTLALTATSTTGTVTMMRFSVDGTTFTAPVAFSTAHLLPRPSGPDRLVTVTAEFVDSTGATGRASASILFDSVPPVLQSASLVPAGRMLTNSTNVTVTYLEGTSAAGSATTQVCVSGDVATMTCAPRSQTQVPVVLSSGDGLKTLSVTLRDAAGNVSAPIVVTVTLDATAPVVSAQAAFFQATTNVLVDLTVTDSSMLTGVRVALSTTAAAPGSIPLGVAQPYADPFTLVVPNALVNENVRAELVVVDAAGNESVRTPVIFHVDQRAPMVSRVFFVDRPTATATNVSTPLMGVSVTDAHESDQLRFCVRQSAQGVAPSTPGPMDSCFQPNPTSLFTFQPTLGPTEGVSRVTVFVADTTQNVGSGFLEVNFDVTPPTGTVASLLGPALRFVGENHQLRVRYVYSPGTDTGSGVAGVQLGVDVSGGTTFRFLPPSVGSALPTALQYEQVIEVPNGSLPRVQLRVVDRAGNVQVAGVVTDTVTAPYAARWPWNPALFVPTADDLRDAMRVPLSGGASRFFIAAGPGQLFSSDNDGLTWTRRDPLSDEAIVSMGVLPDGTVFVASAPPQGASMEGSLAFSTDQGQTFRRARYQPASGQVVGLSPLPGGGAGTFRSFLVATSAGRARVSWNASLDLLDVGGVAPGAWTGFVPCTDATPSYYQLIAGSLSRGVLETSANTLALPAGFTAQRVVSRDSTVVVLALDAANQPALLTTSTCGSTLAAVPISPAFPAGATATHLSLASATNAFVTTRQATTTTVSRVNLVTGARVESTSSNANDRVATGNDTNTAILGGLQGHLARATAFPGGVSELPLRPVPLGALGTTRPVAVGFSVAVGGLNGKVFTSMDGGWADESLPMARDVRGVVPFTPFYSRRPLTAVTGSAELWMNGPPWAVSQAIPMGVVLPPAWEAIRCHLGLCLLAGDKGAIGRLADPTIRPLELSVTVPPTLSGNQRYRAVDVGQLVDGGFVGAVTGHNGTQAVARFGHDFTLGFVEYQVPQATTLTAVALERDSTFQVLGVVVAVGPEGAFISSDEGQTWTRALQTPLRSVTHVPGTTTWLLGGDNGLVLKTQRTGLSFSTPQVVPTGTTRPIIALESTDNGLRVWALTDLGVLESVVSGGP